MQLYQIKYFLAICETGNVTHAAHICNVSQPSMSRGIKKLEQELGEPLLVREASGMRLTAFGQEMQPYFQNMVEVESELLSHARKRQFDRDVRLNVGVMCTLGTQMLQPYLAKLLDVTRDAQIRFVDASGAALLRMMEDDELDLCISGYFHLPQNADAHPLYSERYVISFTKGHRFETLQAVSMGELRNERYVRRLECELRSSLGDMLGETQGPDVDVRYESMHENMVQMMVLSGVGCCIHPETMPVLDGILQRPLDEPRMLRNVKLLVRRQGPRPTLVDRILRMTAAHYGA